MPVREAEPPSPTTKKKLTCRQGQDRSQVIRHSVQWAFVVLNAWLGMQFFLWTRYFERGGVGIEVSRPAGVEGWLPIAGLMNFKYLLSTGRVPSIHPAAMFLFAGFVLISLLMKKSFCSWLCPVGTLSEYLGKTGRRLFGRSLHLPRWADNPLRGLKYLLLGFFVLIIGAMSASALDAFMSSPYGLMADVKMLNFFRNMRPAAAIVIGSLALLSTLIQNFWCRYLCPYGALLGLVSVLSPVKIRRDADACVDCGKCARACPAGLPVDRLVQIRSAECNACMMCVASCSAQSALQLALPSRQAARPAQRWHRRAIGPIAVAAIVAYIFFGVVLFARTTNHWQTYLPHEVYLRLVPQVNQVTHPGI
ncbi:MAG TPA: 4Fe-4S binding protein [Terracidiphilus sp.]|jgi:polyferredoxin